MLLSVIVPIYKTEKTLIRCFESIRECLVSNYEGDFEVILVDDGSPDGAPAICDSIEDCHSFVKVIHKENGGLSSARNAGIDISEGNFLMFVDSDDTLTADIVNAIDYISKSEADILEFSFIRENVHGKSVKVVLPNKDYCGKVKEYWMEGAFQHTYACNKLFRKNLFDTIRFPIGKYFEDFSAYLGIIKNNPRIITTSTIGYNYSYNERSITANAGKKELLDLLSFQIEAYELFKDDSTEKELSLLSYEILNNAISIASIIGVDEFPNELLPRLTMSILSNPVREQSILLHNRIKYITKSTIYKLFGFKTLCKLIQPT